MATPVFIKHMHIAFLAILMWVLNVLADINSQEKTEETLNLAVALGDLNDDTNSDDEPVEDLSTKRKQKTAARSDQLNANVSDATGADLEKISKEMARMDLSFKERVVTKDSSCDFVSREEDDDDTFEVDEVSQEDADIAACDKNNTISEDDEDVTVLKVDRAVEHRVFEIQQSKPKKYKTDEFAKKTADEKPEEMPVEQQSAAKVLIECTKCKRSFGLDIISQHIQFCKTGKTGGDDADD